MLKLSYSQREPLARALAGDESLVVQRRMVLALAGWPLEEAIPLLLSAVEGPTAATRREAAEQLQSQWPAAAALSAHASRQKLAAEAAQLREVWQGEYGAEVARRLAIPRRAPPRNAVEPDRDALVATIERLTASSIHERRAAAHELALKYRESRLPGEALLRLRELVEPQSDALIWADMLLLIGGDEREAAADLAAIAASHSSGEVRRRACGYFGEHPSTRARQVLLNSLIDEDASVAREAERALEVQSAAER